jgi:hypothetical protein
MHLSHRAEHHQQNFGAVFHIKRDIIELEPYNGPGSFRSKSVDGLKNDKLIRWLFEFHSNSLIRQKNAAQKPKDPKIERHKANDEVYILFELKSWIIKRQ